MQAVDGPALELSDIMHTMSPSPAPQIPLPSETMDLPTVHLHSEHNDFVAVPHGISPAVAPDADLNLFPPEPLDHSELETMRFRVHELGLADTHSSHPAGSAVEKELAEMVLRLTSRTVLQPLPSQLASQAETIAELTVQRNLLLHEKEEQCARWEVERQGWDRSAEALIGKRRAANDAAEKDYESERTIARLRDDNSALRHKLSDTITRMSTLESELARLRPLLLMQPAILQDPTFLQHPAFIHFNLPDDRAAVKKKRKGKKEKEREKEKIRLKKEKEKEKDATLLVQPDPEGEGDAEGDMDLEMEADAPPAATEIASEVADSSLLSAPDIHVIQSPSQTQPHPLTDVEGDDPGPSSNIPVPQRNPKQSTSKVEDKPAKKGKDKKGRGKPIDQRTPLLSDARAECLLVAARKMGRVRAGIVADLVKERERAEQERGKEVERLATEIARKAEHDASQAHERMRNAQQFEGEWQYVWESVPVVSAAPAGPATRPNGRPASGSSMPTRPSHFHPSMQAPSTPRQLAPPPAHSRLVQGTMTPYALPHPGLVYMHSPIPVATTSGAHVIQGQAPAGPMVLPVASTWPVPSTPTGTKQSHITSQGRTPLRNGEVEGTPTTPLDSLLSAARTLMIDEDYDGDEAVVESQRPGDSPRRRSASAAALDSPVPKKRKISSGSSMLTESSISSGPSARTRRQTKAIAQQQQSDKGKGKQKGKQKATDQEGKGTTRTHLPAPLGLTRVRSALDVLADQAAQEQERRPSSGPGSRRESVEPEKRQSLTLSRSVPTLSRETAGADWGGSVSTSLERCPGTPTDPLSPSSPRSAPTDSLGQRRPPSAPPAPHSRLSNDIFSPPSLPQQRPQPAIGRSSDDESHPIPQSDFHFQPSTPPSRTTVPRAATEEPSPRGGMWKQRGAETTTNSSTVRLSQPNFSRQQSLQAVTYTPPSILGWSSRTREIEVIPVGISASTTPMEVDVPSPPRASSPDTSRDGVLNADYFDAAPNNNRRNGTNSD